MKLWSNLKTKSKEKKIKPSTGVLMGTCSVDHSLLENYRENMKSILPEASTLVVLAVAHSTSSLDTNNIQIKQYDTLYAYDKAGELTHYLSREIEDEGYKAVAVPVYLPMDMLGEGKGMRGEICWRRAGTAAGLGYFGKNGLLITEEYGPRVRLGGLLTNYPLELSNDTEDHGGGPEKCGECNICLEECPAGALEEASINKKLCGDNVFEYGLRRFASFLGEISTGTEEEVKEKIKSPELRELWQNFMTGCYYYCWTCQSSCPVGRD